MGGNGARSGIGFFSSDLASDAAVLRLNLAICLFASCLIDF